jgi:hypothetical protein
MKHSLGCGDYHPTAKSLSQECSSLGYNALKGVDQISSQASYGIKISLTKPKLFHNSNKRHILKLMAG